MTTRSKARFPARKTHRKSRLGCSNCKNRRIKVIRHNAIVPPHPLCVGPRGFTTLYSALTRSRAFEADLKRSVTSKSQLVPTAQGAPSSALSNERPPLEEPALMMLPAPTSITTLKPQSPSTSAVWSSFNTGLHTPATLYLGTRRLKHAGK